MKSLLEAASATSDESSSWLGKLKDWFKRTEQKYVPLIPLATLIACKCTNIQIPLCFRMRKLMSEKPKFIFAMTKKLVYHCLDMFKDSFVIVGISYFIGSREEYFLYWVSRSTFLALIKLTDFYSNRFWDP